jgi:hypothetical protein
MKEYNLKKIIKRVLLEVDEPPSPSPTAEESKDWFIAVPPSPEAPKGWVSASIKDITAKINAKEITTDTQVYNKESTGGKWSPIKEVQSVMEKINTGAPPTPPTQQQSSQQQGTNMEQTLVGKITGKCGTIWEDFKNRVKENEQKMKGQPLNVQKKIAKDIKQDENKTFRYCHKMYPKTNILPTEKEDYEKLKSGFSKFLTNTWKSLAPTLTNLLTKAVEKGGEKILNSEAKLNENAVIKRIIRKNLYEEYYKKRKKF